MRHNNIPSVAKKLAPFFYRYCAFISCRNIFYFVNTPDYLQTELYALAAADTTVFDFLQTTALDGLWYWNLQTPGHAWANDQLWCSLGYKTGQWPTEAGAWQAALHPADLALLQQKAQSAAENLSTRSFSLVLRFLKADGQLVWMRCWVLLVRDAQRQLVRLMGALFNITREKQEEAYAREVAQHYSSILSNHSVYIIKTDLQGRYTYVNDLFYQRFGYDKNILGTLSLDSIVVEDHPKCIAVVMQCFAEPEMPHQVVLRKPYHDGKTRSNHWEFKGIRDESGQVCEILCVGYDVTLLTESLAETQRLLRVSELQTERLQNFAYIVSHNIRSHSANITSLVGLLGNQEYQAQRDDVVQMLQSSTTKLAETITNLNDIVAINTSGSLPKEPRQLRAEIEKILAAFDLPIRQQQVQVQVEVPATTTAAVVPAYLDSILLNLVSNAIKYRSPERPPRIRLYTCSEPGYTVLAVEDNGLGIDLSKHQSKLFGMYKTFHRNADAGGMGLFISKSQVEAMLGKIEVESQVDVGSTFKVYFKDNG